MRDDGEDYRDYPEDFLEREPRLDDRTIEEWEEMIDKGLEVPEEIVKEIRKIRKEEKADEEYHKRQEEEKRERLHGRHSPEWPGDLEFDGSDGPPYREEPEQLRRHNHKINEPRKLKNLEDVTDVRHIFGLAFEYTAGLYLQIDRPRLIIPQARLIVENGEFQNTHIDFYDYDDEAKDGEIIEAKWGKDFRNIVATVTKLQNAAKSRLNKGKDCGTNININNRERKIQLIVHKKIEGYKNHSVIYNSLEELTRDNSYLKPIRAIDEEMQKLQKSGNYWGLKQLMKATFGMFMTGFETGSFYDIEQYAIDDLMKGQYLPKNLEEYVRDKAMPKTAHANRNDLPKGSTIATNVVFPSDPDSVVIYMKRKR